MTWVEDYLLGVRRGFGDGRQAIRHASQAAVRRLSNWVLPGLMALGVALALLAHAQWMSGSLHMGFFAGRIIFFDYLIFFIGWICGWNAASRWRGRQGVLEELVATNLRPGVVGNILFAGSMGIWVRLLILLALVDGLLLVLQITISTSDINAPAGDYPLWVLIPVGGPLLIVYSLLLAWFHLETLRIAYWMFAVAAMPQVNLLNKAAINFVLIILYVGALTLVGISVSGMTGLFALALREATVGSGNFDNGFSDPFVWMAGALPGLVLVGFLKRQITNLYETDFWKHFLCFTWWGAGEKEFPAFYPLTMLQNVNAWVGVLRLEERQEIARQKNPNAVIPVAMQPSTAMPALPVPPSMPSSGGGTAQPPPLPPPNTFAMPAVPLAQPPALAVDQSTGAPVPPTAPIALAPPPPTPPKTGTPATD